jgi:hypothetical protein
MTKEMEIQFQVLREWSSSLAYCVELCLPNVEAALDGDPRPPGTKPSRQTEAAMEFSVVEEKLSEVVAAVKAIKAGIYATPAAKAPKAMKKPRIGYLHPAIVAKN